LINSIAFSTTSSCLSLVSIFASPSGVWFGVFSYQAVIFSVWFLGTVF